MNFKGKCPNFCKIILKPLWNKLHILITWDVALFVKDYMSWVVIPCSLEGGYRRFG
jgi:hypothetical protein